MALKVTGKSYSSHFPRFAPFGRSRIGETLHLACQVKDLTW